MEVPSHFGELSTVFPKAARILWESLSSTTPFRSTVKVKHWKAAPSYAGGSLPRASPMILSVATKAPSTQAPHVVKRQKGLQLLKAV